MFARRMMVGVLPLEIVLMPRISALADPTLAQSAQPPWLPSGSPPAAVAGTPPAVSPALPAVAPSPAVPAAPAAASGPSWSAGHTAFLKLSPWASWCLLPGPAAGLGAAGRGEPGSGGPTLSLSRGEVVRRQRDQVLSCISSRTRWPLRAMISPEVLRLAGLLRFSNDCVFQKFCQIRHVNFRHA